MKITKDNIGDTLCLYQTGEYIRILDVTARYIYYGHENGSHYAKSSHFVDAFPETNPSRLSVFDKNYILGKTLNAAEHKANEQISLNSEQDFIDTNNVLFTIRSQIDYLKSRLETDRTKREPGEKLASKFISQLSELPAGSHDTFWGHKVHLLSNWTYEFQVDDKKMNYSSAIEYLSKIRFLESDRKPSLSEKILSASIKNKASLSKEFPSANKQHQDTLEH